MCLVAKFIARRSWSPLKYVYIYIYKGRLGSHKRVHLWAVPQFAAAETSILTEIALPDDNTECWRGGGRTAQAK